MESDIEITPENAPVYEQAAALYREGKKEEGIALIKENFGEDAAEKAGAVMAEADKLLAEANAATDEVQTTDDTQDQTETTTTEATS